MTTATKPKVVRSGWCNLTAHPDIDWAHARCNGRVADATCPCECHRPNFEGHELRECREHRTVGPHRAWCFDCTEWCYPTMPCVGCSPVFVICTATAAQVLALIGQATDMAEWRIRVWDEPDRTVERSRRNAEANPPGGEFHG